MDKPRNLRRGIGQALSFVTVSLLQRRELGMDMRVWNQPRALKGFYEGCRRGGKVHAVIEKKNDLDG